LKTVPSISSPDLIAILFRDLTDHEIRVTLLRVIHLFWGKSREFLSVFSDCSFYHLLFGKGTSSRSIFSLQLWLPVLDHFLRWSAPAFAYFSADHRLREVINRNIAILVVNLITPDNLQLAMDCSFFISLGSYCSKGICFQLCEADVFNVLSSALL
jgi:hypothetical protein